MWPTKERKPDDRGIFTYWDGRETRTADPLPIWYELWGIEEVEKLFERAANFEMEAFQELVPHLRKTFDVKPLDEGGLTDNEILILLGEYFKFTRELKKKQGPLPMPWRILAKASSDQSTTPPDADSSSNPPESPSVEPSTASTPSPAPSAAP